MLHKLQNLKRPSPALVIACLALFVSLGGVSYGVATGFIDSREIQNNTVRSKDVRNATLRTEDIRNNEIRGFDVRNSSLQGRDIAFNTLTGADIDEASLGKVDSATEADTAAALPNLKTFSTKLASGAAATLVTHGPLTLTAACQDVAGSTTARLRVQTTEGNSAGSDVPIINPSDGPVVVAELADAPGAPRSAASRTLFASAPSGSGLTGEFGLVVETGGMGTCIFNGHAVLEG